MRIESVTAHAFGPLINQTQPFAEGLTVLYGLNESSKSTWHAAAYAALCGRRRGKGRVSKDDQLFSEAHRPWDSTDWLVSATVVLDDGRRIELRQDLAGNVDCRATDLVLGRDVSNEIIFEGSPDASVWLGLDRRSFLATACIGQAQLLSVLDQADGLQQHLQQAAATAGTDATATAALARLDIFQREQVGTDRANSTKPLRLALNRRDLTATALDRARSGHAEFAQLMDQSDTAIQRAKQSETESRRQHDLARQFADAYADSEASNTAARQARYSQDQVDSAAKRREGLTRRAGRARILWETCGGVAPVTLDADDQLARRATTAIHLYSVLAAPVELNGLNAAALAAELEVLPQAPTGDLEPNSLVADAAQRGQDANLLAASHIQSRPQPIAEPTSELAAALAKGPGPLRDVASALAAPIQTLAKPESIGVLDAQHERDEAAGRHHLAMTEMEDARAGYDSARAMRDSSENHHAAPLSKLALVLAGGLVVGAVAAFAAGSVPSAVALLIAAVVAGVVAVLRRGRGVGEEAQGPSAALRESAAAVDRASNNLDTTAQKLTAAERLYGNLIGQVEAAEQARAGVEQQRQSLAEWAEKLGLPRDPTRLRDLASAVEQYASATAASQMWQGQDDDLQASVLELDRHLATALSTRGAMIGNKLSAQDAWAEYRLQCRKRAHQAQAAATRGQLERELIARRAAEQQHALQVEQRNAAVTELAAAAQQVTASAPGKSDEQNAAELQTWLSAREIHLREISEAQSSWTELVTLLDGDTVEQSELAAQDAIAAVAQLSELADKAERTATGAAEHAEKTAAAVGHPGADTVTIHWAMEAANRADELCRDQQQAAEATANKSAGRLTERARSLASVAEAEEVAKAAEAELARVKSLDTILATTIAFLSHAQDRVHRTIAPMLTATLTEWLPSITAGRYVSGIVDPKTLHVEVCGPDRLWRHAELLSHGTAEQVYLLLRAALAQHLTARHESCPLLLDDVTVQADSQRTPSILRMLHTLSESRQIILFAQELQVADWARENLMGERDLMVELSPPT